eukprot:1831563-Pyramimonas_sp.AAC.1
MRVYATAAAKRAAVVKEDDLLTKADLQANPVNASTALCNGLCASREVRDGTCHRSTLGTSGIRGPRSLPCGGASRNGAAVESATTRQRGSAQEAVDHCFP